MAGSNLTFSYPGIHGEIASSLILRLRFAALRMRSSQ